jgi:mono/diheme cytochrome c family protein
VNDMTTNTPLAAIAAALLLASVARAAEPPKKTPELVAKGQTTFSKFCASCHGPKGEGDGPAAKALNPKPKNLATDALAHGATAQGVFDTLSTGVKGTAMVPFKHLSEEDRWAVAYYVMSLREGAKKK